MHGYWRDTAASESTQNVGYSALVELLQTCTLIRQWYSETFNEQQKRTSVTFES